MYNVYVYTISLLLQLQNVILEEGEEFAGLLYTWRSLSRAVPAVCSHTHSSTHLFMCMHVYSNYLVCLLKHGQCFCPRHSPLLMFIL